MSQKFIEFQIYDYNDSHEIEEHQNLQMNMSWVIIQFICLAEH